MTFNPRTALGFAIAPFLAVSAIALEWKTETQTATTAPFQNELVVVYAFTNKSEKTVAIREIETSCSCLKADADQKTYAPGASGTLTAKFAVGDRGGSYERSVTVNTDEQNGPTHLLLKVEVPEIGLVTPRSVEWKLNEDPTEKTVEVNALSDLEIVFTSAQATSDAYSIRLEPVKDGRLYRLHIKPNSTVKPVSAAVRLYGREKSGHDVLLSAYASVH
jgi:Protein of unknown function (DUF1573)